jgi:hypothetical protein
MSKREDEKYAAWIKEVSEELPEEAREAFETLAETDVAKERFFRGSIRTDDYHRRLNEVDEMKKELEGARDELYAWYEEETPKQEALIEERDLLKQQLAEREGSGDPPPAAGIPGFSTEDLAALKAKADKIEALDKIMPAVIADVGAITQDAFKNEFEVDMHEVMRVSLQQGVTPYKAYEDLTSSQRKDRYDKAQEEQRNKWIEEGKRQALTAKTGSPDALGPAGPVWENLTKKDDGDAPTSRDRVSAALAELVETGGV